MTLAFARNNCHKLGTEVMMGRKTSLSSFPSVSTYSYGFHSRRKVYRSVLMCTEVGVGVGFKEGEVRLRVELKRNSLPVMVQMSFKQISVTLLPLVVPTASQMQWDVKFEQCPIWIRPHASDLSLILTLPPPPPSSC